MPAPSLLVDSRSADICNGDLPGVYGGTEEGCFVACRRDVYHNWTIFRCQTRESIRCFIIFRQDTVSGIHGFRHVSNYPGRRTRVTLQRKFDIEDAYRGHRPYGCLAGK